MNVTLPKCTHPPSFIQGQDGQLFPSSLIQDLWDHAVVQTPPADQNLLDVQLPEEIIRKAKNTFRYER